jgi:phosphoribosylformylglycinamidine cyclo-ligase
MVLAGGETAQMPGLYQPGHFDLAGTIIGMVEEADALHGDRITAGDMLIGLASTGLHTNGYTLARRVVFERAGLKLDDELPGTAQSVADALLAVHRSYAAAVTPVLPLIHGIAHITGGGIAGNLVRVLPAGCAAVVEPGSWRWPALFQFLQRAGDISTDEMRDVFNLGIGLILVVPGAAVAPVHEAADSAGVESWAIGRITTGDPAVHFAG